MQGAHSVTKPSGVFPMYTGDPLSIWIGDGPIHGPKTCVSPWVSILKMMQLRLAISFSNSSSGS